MDRTDFYFRQRVREAELDLAFELAEEADRNLASDIGLFGIVGGAVPAPHEPVADLSIDLTAPARAYDRLGRRIFYGTGQTVDCSVDSTGSATEVDPADGAERWLGVFLRFDRLLSDERTDGNSQRIFFRRDESFQLVVRQGPPAGAGAAPRVALQEDELLVCDVLRRAGQTQIVEADIDVSRRQAFVFAQASSVGVFPELWNVLRPGVPTLQATLDDADEKLNTHFRGEDNRHGSAQIDYTPSGFLNARTVQAAIDQIVSLLSRRTSGSAGATRIGADAVAGTPRALSSGTVDAQISSLLSWLNSHLSATSAAHAASAIAATAHNWVTGTSVQQQLQNIVEGLTGARVSVPAYRNLTSTNVQAQIRELVDDLRSTAASRGASLIGSQAVDGTPHSIGNGNLQTQLGRLIARLNTHAGSGDHDSRYMRQVFSPDRVTLGASAAQRVGLVSSLPDLLVFTTDIDGLLTPFDFRVFLTAQKRTINNEQRWDITAQNRTATTLDVIVRGYDVR